MELMQILQTRRSGRNYTSEPIGTQELQSILKAGLLAPSSRNRKSTEFITVSDRNKLIWLSTAKAAGGTMLKNAAYAIIVYGNSELSDAWIEDGSIAMTNMMLRATELGIANCWVQIRNRYSDLTGANGPISADERIRAEFGIPDTHRVLAILSLGYPAEAMEAHDDSEIIWSKVHSAHD